MIMGGKMIEIFKFDDDWSSDDNDDDNDDSD